MKFTTLLDIRITPAYAGKSNSESTMSLMPIGSPPPMRGKVLYAGGFREAVRITPAYAGKSKRFTKSSQRREDHPRLCGEKSCFFSASYILNGSPPPMRGKEAPTCYRNLRIRITPAYAGKSSYDFSRFFFV